MQQDTRLNCASNLESLKKQKAFLNIIVYSHYGLQQIRLTLLSLDIQL